MRSHSVVESWLAVKRVFRTESAAKLKAAGFVTVEEDEILGITPPPDCEYFWKDRFLIPIATR